MVVLDNLTIALMLALAASAGFLLGDIAGTRRERASWKEFQRAVCQLKDKDPPK